MCECVSQCLYFLFSICLLLSYSILFLNIIIVIIIIIIIIIIDTCLYHHEKERKGFNLGKWEGSGRNWGK
jgi:ABC-type bacteriocin/lantibiotic exporter with double-glycine peptidase domain